ncbi:MAG: fumarylacetoacetate hydrolase family protein [Elusimicrobia bacterium]|nr:fumarylacetoacetate hydrolase family protein [Elusimicrobiota bacterium]
MKFVRFVANDSTGSQDARWGLIKDDDIEIISGSPFDKWEKTPEMVKVYDARFLAPCQPGKIVCIGLNYQDHADEIKMRVPDEPVLFIKPSTAVIGPEAYIVKPRKCKILDFEAELGVVISRTARNISAEDADNYILGYTCFNDVTARDIQRKDGQWTRAKSFDSFAPLGPCISAGIDPNRLKIESLLNGEVRQSSNTSRMVFNIQRIVSYVSETMTLYPQDVITTGTPPGVGKMDPGDVVEVVIEHIGSLRNYVTQEE